MKQFYNVKRGIALLCSALILSFSILSLPITVNAATTGANVDIDYTDVDFCKIADIILTQQGVVPRGDILTEVVDDYITDMKDGLVGIKDILTFNSTDTCDRDTFSANLDDAGISGYKKEVYLNAYDLYCEDGTYSWMDTAENITNGVTRGLKRYLVDDGIKKGTTYTMDDEVVKDINKVFQDWWASNGDYIIYRVPAVSELPVTGFKTKSAIEQLKAAIAAIEEEGATPFIQLSNGYSANSYTGSVSAFKSDVRYFVAENLWGARYLVQAYDDNWTMQPKHVVTLNDTSTSYSYQTDGFVYEYHSYNDASVSGDGFLEWYYYSTYAGGGFILSTPVSTVAHNIKIFRSVNKMKLYDCGQQSVYFSPTYDNSVTNTVTYTGDYYCNTSGVYNYGTVQDSINNIDGDVTDSIVDSVVDESVTNITNNYYYNSGTGDGTGDGSGSSDSTDSSNPFDGLLGKLGDVLGNAIGVLDDILALALGFIVDGFNVILSLFSSIIDLLGTFKEETAGLSGALTAFFPFIPEEIWTIVTSTITIICGLAIIKYFMSK